LSKFDLFVTSFANSTINVLVLFVVRQT